MSETVTVTGHLKDRKPRHRVLVNGQEVSCEESSFTQSGFFHASTFRCLMLADLQPGQAPWYDLKAADTNGQTISLPIRIQYGFAPDDESDVVWTTMLLGLVDRLNADEVRGSIEITGRDYTARLIDTRLQQAFLNVTASQVAAQFAAEHAMVADIVPTTTLVGSYYQISHSGSTLTSHTPQGTEWDFLTRLARHEHYDAWVDHIAPDGSEQVTLHFRPAQTNTANPFHVLWVPPANLGNAPTLNISELSMDRSLNLANDIKVTVSSRDYRKKANSVGVYPIKPKLGAVEYQYVYPGLDTQQAQARAEAIYRDLVRHERVIEGRMAGELQVTPRRQLVLSGTGTTWDQTYWIDTVTRSLSVAGGFDQRVTARNQSPSLDTEASA